MVKCSSNNTKMSENIGILHLFFLNFGTLNHRLRY